MLIYNSGYLTANFLEIQYLLHLQWTEPASLLDLHGIYAETVNFFNRRIHRRARHFLFDLTQITKRIDLQYIEWFNSYILPKIASVKADKIAYLTNETEVKIFPEVKYVTVNGRKIEQRVFTDQAQATQWLLDGAQRKDFGKSSHHHH